MTAITSISLGAPATGILKAPEIQKDYGFIQKFKDLTSNPAVALEKLQNKVFSGAKFSPSELLGYQIMAHRFGLSIEVATKIADGISTSVRKLQNQ